MGRSYSSETKPKNEKESYRLGYNKHKRLSARPMTRRRISKAKIGNGERKTKYWLGEACVLQGSDTVLMMMMATT